MGRQKWVVVDRLKKAVKKITSLLSFSLTKWRLSCLLRRASTRRRRLSLSFNDRLGLHGCIEEDHQQPNGANGSSSVRALQRSTSYAYASSSAAAVAVAVAVADDNDVDRRAEDFISNFRRQLWFERQVSLELRYFQSRRSSDSD